MYVSMKKVRLTEGDLRRVVNESVDKVLNEAYGTPDSRTRTDLVNLGHTLRNYDNGDAFASGLKGYQDGSGDIHNKDLLIAFNNAYTALNDLKVSLWEMDNDEWVVGKSVFKQIYGKSEQLEKLIGYAIKKLQIASGEHPDNFHEE